MFVPRKIVSNIKVKLCMWFIITISGFTKSLRLASGVAQDIIGMLHWIAERESIKSFGLIGTISPALLPSDN